jgi:hypothetical protein
MIFCLLVQRDATSSYDTYNNNGVLSSLTGIVLTVATVYKIYIGFFGAENFQIEFLTMEGQSLTK